MSEKLPQSPTEVKTKWLRSKFSHGDNKSKWPEPNSNKYWNKILNKINPTKQNLQPETKFTPLKLDQSSFGESFGKSIRESFKKNGWELQTENETPQTVSNPSEKNPEKSDSESTSIYQEFIKKRSKLIIDPLTPPIISSEEQSPDSTRMNLSSSTSIYKQGSTEPEPNLQEERPEQQNLDPRQTEQQKMTHMQFTEKDLSKTPESLEIFIPQNNSSTPSIKASEEQLPISIGMDQNPTTTTAQEEPTNRKRKPQVLRKKSRPVKEDLPKTPKGHTLLGKKEITSWIKDLWPKKKREQRHHDTTPVNQQVYDNWLQPTDSSDLSSEEQYHDSGRGSSIYTINQNYNTNIPREETPRQQHLVDLTAQDLNRNKGSRFKEEF
jgi:hypothetical protein